MRVCRFIKSVAKVAASSLSGMHIIGCDKCVLPSGVSFTPICVDKHPEMIITDEWDGNVRLFNTSLTFISPDFKPSPEEPMALKVTDEDGHAWIIGCQEAPFPVIVSSDPRPRDPAAMSCPSFELRWKSPLAPLKVLL